MKYLKMLGLAAIAACALMAFVGAGSASATTLTCTEPAGTKITCPKGTEIHAVSEGKAVLDAPFGNIECESTVTGKTSNTGSSTETVKGPIESLTFTNCGNDTVTVLKKGELEIHTFPNEKEWEEGKGTLTSTGTEVTVIHLGVHCIYTTSATDIGTLTGSKQTGATPTLDISATIPRTGGNSGAFCGTSAPWTGSYKVTTPDWMDVD
ncbi:MAG: hypothetical protein ACTHO8_04805 [Solirubrobacterales bacterium]